MIQMDIIPFNKPYMTGKELDYIRDAHGRGVLSANGIYTQKCNAWLEEKTGCLKALLTRSCTDALEMAALLIGIQPGDEIILPSYSYVSSANAFLLFGAVPVFIDIREDTLNIDETKIEPAVTPQTKAIIVTHYAGIAADMDAIMAIAKKHNLIVIEDAAHAVMSCYNGRPLGSIGHISALSFHETKNIIAGEGGAILINDERFIDKTMIVAQKGTNRSQFLNGEVDKYTWVGKGSSYMPSELTSAFLWAQMESAEEIIQKRKDIWDTYYASLAPLEKKGILRRPVIPQGCEHNAHIYYMILKNKKARDSFISKLRENGIHSVFHFVPLHQSPAGKKFGRTSGALTVTEKISECLARLPLWIGVEDHLDNIINKVILALESKHGS